MAHGLYNNPRVVLDLFCLVIGVNIFHFPPPLIGLVLLLPLLGYCLELVDFRHRAILNYYPPLANLADGQQLL